MPVIRVAAQCSPMFRMNIEIQPPHSIIENIRSDRLPLCIIVPLFNEGHHGGDEADPCLDFAQGPGRAGDSGFILQAGHQQ